MKKLFPTHLTLRLHLAAVLFAALSTVVNAAQTYTFGTLAGLAGSPGTTDGTGSAARFSLPSGVGVDSAGNVYGADTFNHTIRKVTPGGVVTTLAGLAGVFGSTDDTGSAARFYFPHGVAVDSAGNVYVADTDNHTIRKVTSVGTVSTLAGQAGSNGSSDGTGSAARFKNPRGVAVDSAGNVYVTEYGNHTIRMVTPGGVVTTLAGLAGSFGSSDGTGSAARFNCPAGVGVDSAGNVYVADSVNHTIRMVTPGGVVTTLVGLAGSLGSSDGTGSAARFHYPSGVAVNSAGNVFVGDTYNHTIRKIAPGAGVTTIGGLAGSLGSSDGTGSVARFRYPYGVAVDNADNVYVADAENHTIRKGVVTNCVSGETWTPRESNRIWRSVASSDDGTKLVAVVSGGLIYTSTDSGVTWTARDSLRNWRSVASSADGTKLVAVTYGGQIYTSTDLGATWTARESNRPWYSVASSADGTKLVAVVYGGGQIYTSTDSGSTWTARESNRHWHYVASSADGTKLVAVVDGGQIYTSACAATLVLTCAINKTVNCGTPWSFDPPTVVGSCSGTNVAVTILSTATNGVCPQVITRTWLATDACGNTNTCSQTVTNVDTTPPVIICATNKTVQCGTALVFDVPTASDACSGTNVTLTILTTITQILTPCISQVTRIWQATDACGNTSTCSQTVTVVDTTPPVFICATNKSVVCGTAWTFDAPTASDACSGTNVTVTILSTVTNAPCVITRTWLATDLCGNTNTCSQTVTIVDTTPPVFISGLPQSYGPPLQLPGFGSNPVAAYGINNAGQIVGTSFGANNNALIWTPTSGSYVNPPTTLPNGGSANVSAFAINAMGQVVGSAAGPSILWTPVVGVFGSPISLPTGLATAINANGVIVGVASGGPVIWIPILGVYNLPTTLPIGGFSNLVPEGINDAGTIVGGSGAVAVLWTLNNNIYSPPALLPSGVYTSGTTAKGINAAGQIVGVGNAGAGERPILWTPIGGVYGLPSELPILYGGNWQACGINDAGQIVGLSGASTSTSFIWSPLTTPNCLPDKTVQCGTNWTFDVPTASDACSGTNVTVTILSTVTNGVCPQVITRTWRATDACGNTNTCTQMVTVVDTTPPIFIAAPGSGTGIVGTYAGRPIWQAAAVGTTTTVGFATLDNGSLITSGNTDTFFASLTLSGAEFVNVRSYYNTFVYVGPNSPLHVNLPLGTYSFGTDLYPFSGAPGVYTITLFPSGQTFTVNSGSGAPGPDFFGVVSATPIASVEFSYNNSPLVLDNFSFTTQPLVSTCPTNKTVPCGTNWSFDAPTAYDACSGTNVTVTILSTVTNGPCPVITRTWLATDLCGNTNTCKQTVTIVDTTPPVITCATNKTVQCGTAWTFDVPTASDACSGTNVAITILKTVTNGICPQVITRTWKATDVCGNTNTCIQIVTVVDDTPPVITCATNKTVICGTAWTFDTPTAVDACSGANVTIFIINTVTNGSCPQVITRTWLAMDACGNCEVCSQTVTVVDTTPPVITCATNKTVNIGTAWTFDAPTASDTCSGTNVTITILQTVTNGTACAQVITRTWLAMDACGNCDTCSQTVTVVDGTPPVVLCLTNTIYVALNTNCQLEIPTIHPPASDNCTPTSQLVYTQNPPAGTIVVAGGLCQTVTVTVTDASGNASQCQVLVCGYEGTPPVLICPNSVVMTNCFVPNVLALVSASDNCTASNLLVFTQSPHAGTPIAAGGNSVTVTVTDQSGNVATCVIPLVNSGPNSFLDVLFNTGVNAGKVVLLDDSVDPHYTLNIVPVGTPTGVGFYNAPNAIAVTPAPWGLGAGVLSRWINPGNSPGVFDANAYPLGNYTYTHEFVLPAGADPGTASISGRWAADDGGGMYFNGLLLGNQVSLIAAPGGSGAWKNFTINSPGFLANPAVNKIYFVVTNAPVFIFKRVTGLRVEFKSAVINCSTCSPPVIFLQTPDQSLPLGGTATFNVTGVGTLPVTIQWYHNGLPLANGGHYSGVNTPNLIVMPVSYVDEGTYYVVISNACGSVRSQARTLAVTSGWPWDWAWWDFAQIGSPVKATFGPDLIMEGTNNLGVSSGTTYDFELPSLGGKIVNVMYVPPLPGDTLIKLPLIAPPGGSVSNYTLITDILLPSDSTNRATFFTIFDRWGNLIMSSSPGVAGEVLRVSGRVDGMAFNLDSAMPLPRGRWNRIALAVVNGQTGDDSVTLSLYVNGKPAGRTSITKTGADTLVLGSNSVAAVFSSPEGTACEMYVACLQFHAVTMTPQMIAMIGSPDNGPIDPAIIAGANQGGGEPPTVLRVQSMGQGEVVGATVIFSASVTGQPPFTYQWRKDGTNLIGSVSSSLALNNVALNQSGLYSVIVTGPAGTMSSSPCRLIVTTSLFQPPAPQTTAAIRSQGFRLNLLLETGRAFRVQAATELRNPVWTDVTNFVSTGAALQFIDAAATNQTRRFYRVVSP